jgi:hypothetical protein
VQQPMQQKMSIRSARPITPSTSSTSAAKTNISTARPIQRPVIQSSKSRPLKLQLEQLKAKAQALDSRRKQTLSPLYRQGLDNQINTLQNQIQTLTVSLHQIQSQERIPLWENLLALLRSDVPNQESWNAILETWKKIYPLDLVVFSDGSKNQLFQIWSQSLQKSLASFAAGAAISIDDWHLSEILQEQSQGVLAAEQLKWADFINFFKSYLPKVNENALPETAAQEVAVNGDFQFLTLDFPKSSQPDAPLESSSLLRETQASGAELEVRFDMGSGRSLVKNSMGIVLNQEKKSYQEYLDLGFSFIDRVVDSEFANTKPLQEAIAVFLEAISLNKERHEAYFGLGYLYSLVRDLNHSLYFLNLSWRISKDIAIENFIKKVKDSYGVA